MPLILVYDTETLGLRTYSGGIGRIRSGSIPYDQLLIALFNLSKQLLFLGIVLPTTLAQQESWRVQEAVNLGATVTYKIRIFMTGKADRRAESAVVVRFVCRNPTNLIGGMRVFGFH